MNSTQDFLFLVERLRIAQTLSHMSIKDAKVSFKNILESNKHCL